MAATSTEQSQSMIVVGTNLDINSDILYTKPKLNSNGGKSVGVLNAHTKKGLYISSPLMLTWGLNENDFEGTGKKTYDMSLQFPSAEYQNEATTAFLVNMSALEAKFKADAIKNSKEWMNKNKLSAEVVDALWTPMLRYPKDKETGEFDRDRAPTLRIKLPFWEGAFKAEIYDVDKKLLYPNSDGIEIADLITKAINVATVIQCGGFWFANGKFGVTWKLLQCVVKPKASMRGVCHIDLTDSDKERMVKPDDDDDNVSDDGKKKVALVDDSDDEDAESKNTESKDAESKDAAQDSDGDEDDDDDENAEEDEVPPPPPKPTPPPASAPKKRVVRKKPLKSIN